MIYSGALLKRRPAFQQKVTRNGAFFWAKLSKKNGGNHSRGGCEQLPPSGGGITYAATRCGSALID